MWNLTSKSFFNVERVAETIQTEAILILFVMAASTWLVYRFLLKEVSEERHRNLRVHLNNLVKHVLIWAVPLVAYLLLLLSDFETVWILKLQGYLGLTAIAWGVVVFIKSSRLLTLEYFFLNHMREGVPLLLVNIFTLVLSMVMVGWFLNHFFGFEITHLVATSAVFSIVLGLALQDTLGNLFAGVALQLDKPYELGDWIEIQNGAQKYIGQVQEVSWRATVLATYTDEVVTIPNRTVAQSQVINSSGHFRPIVRSQVFRVPFGTNIERAREILTAIPTQVPTVLMQPKPLVQISEVTESWISLKLIYFLRNIENQYSVADKVLELGLTGLAQAKIPPAATRVELIHPLE